MEALVCGKSGVQPAKSRSGMVQAASQPYLVNAAGCNSSAIAGLSVQVPMANCDLGRHRLYPFTMPYSLVHFMY